jgi:hypothetical protein
LASSETHKLPQDVFHAMTSLKTQLKEQDRNDAINVAIKQIACRREANHSLRQKIEEARNKYAVLHEEVASLFCRVLSGSTASNKRSHQDVDE